VATSLLNRKADHHHAASPSIGGVLQKIDTPSILFFLGILLAVAALQTAGELEKVADFLNASIGNIWGINLATGLLSSVVDNVPLVAAAMGMYPLSVYPADHTFWELLAFCAGTGGSVLVIGSAAGVAMMGSLKIEFMWYLRTISFPALLGYLAGMGVFYLMSQLV
jgi:Na+/H+ antiporter NhaD/arsenite permease-like protein